MPRELEINGGKLFGIVLLIAIFLIGIFALFGSFYIVEAGNRGVVLTMGEVNPIESKEGFHLKLPFIQNVIMMSVRTEKYETDASAASRDLQIVHTKIAVNYHLKPEAAPTTYREVGLGYSDKLIQPAVQEVVKASTAQFAADELITKRESVKELIEKNLVERLGQRQIVVEAISITNFDFSADFNSIIEAKVVAQQNSLKAENDLVRIKVEKEQTITQAEAQAESRKRIAEAEAYSTKIKADSEAYALKVVREQLDKNTGLIQYKSIEKWNGGVPMYTGTGAVPFIDITQTK